LALEALFAGEAEELARVALKLARGGDTVALKMIFDRLSPPPRGRLVCIPGFPKIKSLADVPGAMAHLAACVASGVITADEAADVANVVKRFTEAINAVDHELRLAAIEQTLKEHHAPNFRR
jgi:hypothetical protein